MLPAVPGSTDPERTDRTSSRTSRRARIVSSVVSFKGLAGSGPMTIDPDGNVVVAGYPGIIQNLHSGRHPRAAADDGLSAKKPISSELRCLPTIDDSMPQSTAGRSKAFHTNLRAHRRRWSSALTQRAASLSAADRAGGRLRPRQFRCRLSLRCIVQHYAGVRVDGAGSRAAHQHVRMPARPSR